MISFSSIIIIIIWVFLKNNKNVDPIEIKFGIFFIAIVIIRLFIPIELDIANTVDCTFLLPDMVSFMNLRLVPIRNSYLYVYHILYIVLVTGTLIGFIRSLIIFQKFKTSIYQLPAEMHSRIQPILQKVLEKHSKPCYFSIMLSSTITTPLIFGLIKPTIVLPDSDFSDDEFFYIFSHEVRHHYNHDLLFKYIMESLCLLYWWNPFVLLLKKQISKALELHTDIMTTKSMSELERINYMECLLKTAKNQKKVKEGNLILTLNSDNGCTLKQRYHIVMDCRNSKPTNKNIKSIFLTGTLVLTLKIGRASCRERV